MPGGRVSYRTWRALICRRLQAWEEAGIRYGLHSERISWLERFRVRHDRLGVILHAWTTLTSNVIYLPAYGMMECAIHACQGLLGKVRYGGEKTQLYHGLLIYCQMLSHVFLPQAD